MDNASSEQKNQAPIIHTIAGSESSGSAGGQVDLRVFADNKCFGLASFTSIVSFMPKLNWQHIFTAISPDLLKQQLQASTAHKPNCIKIGMLGDIQTIDIVAQFLGKHISKKTPIVVDPVLVCKGESAQSSDVEVNNLSKNTQTENAQIRNASQKIDQALQEKIIPLADVITPNLEEAEILSGIKHIKNTEDILLAGKQILQLGCRAVIIKGGNRLAALHPSEPAGKQAIDILITPDSSSILAQPINKLGVITGAGCTFSAALACSLAQKKNLEEAFAHAKNYTYQAIINSVYSKLPLVSAGFGC
ncbi:MAG: hydroxymethylpyrimidine/phosphomethylpyrimidine kinase [Bifidobacteriaceae bacterium]|jgi:pyridoxine kinase|nr:hydroxymethylpyrimidine/phosphomethylpyrimidine kinase [Bifidobacteriaceae bacterium]